MEVAPRASAQASGKAKEKGMPMGMPMGMAASRVKVKWTVAAVMLRTPCVCEW
jgi:hypothetical protein